MKLRHNSFSKTDFKVQVLFQYKEEMKFIQINSQIIIHLLLSEQLMKLYCTV